MEVVMAYGEKVWSEVGVARDAGNKKPRQLEVGGVVFSGLIYVCQSIMGKQPGRKIRLCLEVTMPPRCTTAPSQPEKAGSGRAYMEDVAVICRSGRVAGKKHGVKGSLERERIPSAAAPRLK
jgi:hypothetical protein